MAMKKDMLFRFLGDTKSLENAARRAERSIGGMSKEVTGADRAMTGLKKGAALAAGAIGAMEVARWAGDAVQMAVAAEEVDSKFESVFGTATELTAALEAWGDMAGVTTTEAKGLASTFGNLAIAQGISADTAQQLSLDVAKLAGDMASFNDADPALVFDDLNKALLTTEREGMKKYGIAITEAEVKTRAAAIAASEGRTEITKADRAYASYAIAVEQAGSAIGDLERTSDSAANRQRQMQATLRETQEAIGQELLPVWYELLEAAEDLIPLMQDLAGGVGGVVAPISRMSDEFKDADDEGSALSKTVNNLGEGLNFIVSPLRWVKDAMADAGVETKELEKKARELSDGMEAYRLVQDSINTQLGELKVNTREATEAQADYREEVQDSYQPLTDYDAKLAMILDKYRIAKGLQPDWDAWTPPDFLVNGSYDPNAAARIGELESMVRRLESIAGSRISIDLSSLKVASQAEIEQAVTRAIYSLQRRGVITPIPL